LIRVAATLLGCLSSGAVAQRAGAAVSGAATVVQRRMPRVIGLPLGEALNVVLSSTGLKCGARRLQGGNPSPTDSVVRQIPAAEQVPANTTVCTLFVLPHASPQVPLNPNVVGRSIEDAIAILKRAELNPHISTVATTDSALNSVIGQNPSSKAPIRSDRAIDHGRRRSQCDRPSLADATSALERAHLRRGSTSEREVPTGANNAVLDQRPAAGQRAAPLTLVNLLVARVVVPVTVPLLIGQQLDRATQMLTDAHLVLGPVDSADSQRPVGIVIGQSRPQQTSVPPGTSIGVTVARRAAFRMPNLVGLTIADARATSARAGLTVGSLKIANAEGRPDTVVGQTPVAGATVRSGDTVTLVGGRAITPVVVPPLAPNPPSRGASNPPPANPGVATPPVTTPPSTIPPGATADTASDRANAALDDRSESISSLAIPCA
jgi:beta-lactam-binding protein with PASTA domain